MVSTNTRATCNQEGCLSQLALFHSCSLCLVPLKKDLNDSPSNILTGNFLSSSSTLAMLATMRTFTAMTLVHFVFLTRDLSTLLVRLDTPQNLLIELVPFVQL